MNDVRRPTTGYPMLLSLLAAFAAGVLAERAGLVPGGGPRQPAALRNTFAPFWEAWSIVHEHYVDRRNLDDTTLARGAITGMVDALGDTGHTAYLSPDEVKRMEADLKGELEGIGAVLGYRKHRPTIGRTMPDSPARKAGLKGGDVLLKVDGKDVEGLSVEQIVQRVRGKAGTQVKLTVLREGTSKPLEFTITRGKVQVHPVAWRMLPGAPVAHIALQEFGESASEEMKKALADARKQKARALIVDVRDNPGGLKDQAVAVTSAFLKKGEVVFIEQDARGKQTRVPVTDGEPAAGDLPVCVLIDEGTASSAEIFAGALQDYGRAKLVGTKTFGTGTVLEPFDLSDGSAVLLAVDQWLTPRGRKIWHGGIKPDVEVDLAPDAEPLHPDDEGALDADALKRSQDKQLLKALELLKEQIK
jgi:carboxyl-terminal processing protease